MSDPVPFFRAVAATHPRCFWLTGGDTRKWSGPRSIVGWLDDEDVSLTYDAARGEVRRHGAGASDVVGGDVFAALEAELDAGRPTDQWFGYFGYASRPDLPAATGSGVPDAVWMRARHVRMFDHELTGVNIQMAARATTSAHDPAYERAFKTVQQHLHAGNSYEVNLTYREQQRSDVDPATAYLRLRELNPAPYAGFLQHDLPDARAWLLSSSPERYALIDADRTIETKPIKGTTPRGATPEEDALLRHRLAAEPRFRAENLMITDLLRNDLSMVCRPGSVEVTRLMVVESYETVHQLVSTIRGRLRDDVTTAGALRTLFPAGSMTGAPKLRTMQIIEQVETSPRGPYAGAFGWVSADGRADLGVVIRSLATGGDGSYLLGTGGGITVHSDVAEEYAESRWKVDRLREVFTRF
jgi:para-aminobenzoate synthetase